MSPESDKNKGVKRSPPVEWDDVGPSEVNTREDAANMETLVLNSNGLPFNENDILISSSEIFDTIPELAFDSEEELSLDRLSDSNSIDNLLFSDNDQSSDSDLATMKLYPPKSADEFLSVRGEREGLKFNPARSLEQTPVRDRPIDYFRLLLDNELIQLIVKNTNEYAQVLKSVSKPAARINRWKPMTSDEFLSFIGLLYHTGTIKHHFLVDYWSTENVRRGLLHVPCFPRVMSRDRFFSILDCIRFTSVTINRTTPVDRHSEIRPLVDFFNDKLKRIYVRREENASDETIFLWRGRLTFRYRNKTKHNLKLLMLSDTNGVALRFLLGAEKKAVKPDDDVVSRITWTSKNETLTMPVQWTGNFDRVESFYNENRSKIKIINSERVNDLLSFYPCECKTIRWYVKLAIHIFHLFLIDSHRFYCMDGKKRMTLYEYRLDVIEELTGLRSDCTSSSLEIPSSGGHFPVATKFNDVRKRRIQLRCRNCSKKGVKNKHTSYFCSGCPDQVGLCVECFREWHN